jgi:hypothetical protein
MSNSVRLFDLQFENARGKREFASVFSGAGRVDIRHFRSGDEGRYSIYRLLHWPVSASYAKRLNFAVVASELNAYAERRGLSVARVTIVDRARLSFEDISPVLLLAPVNASEPAESYLARLSRWVPRRHREPWVGDILEDLRDMRDEGCTEKELRRHVRWQAFCAVVERLRSMIRSRNWFLFVAIKRAINSFHS